MSLHSWRPLVLEPVSCGAVAGVITVPPVPHAADLALLTSDECARAARFAFTRDQSAFVTTRAAIRRALGQALSCLPEDVEIVSGVAGRPALSPSHGSALDFNVSHSGSLALIALSPDRRVGADIECHAPDRGLRELVPQVMGAGERALLDAQESDAAFCHEFYACWTRKEALVKGLGVGLSADLTSFDVPRVPADGVVTIPSEVHPVWRIVTVEPAPGFTASVAVADARSVIAFAPFADVIFWRGEAVPAHILTGSWMSSAQSMT